jgi:hypothetical protein
LRHALACLAALGLTGAAAAAELPARAEKSERAAQTTRECEIDGERGVALPGGGCVRVSGYVSVGVGAGNVRH